MAAACAEMTRSASARRRCSIAASSPDGVRATTSGIALVTSGARSTRWATSTSTTATSCVSLAAYARRLGASERCAVCRLSTFAGALSLCSRSSALCFSLQCAASVLHKRTLGRAKEPSVRNWAGVSAGLRERKRTLGGCQHARAASLPQWTRACMQTPRGRGWRAERTPAMVSQRGPNPVARRHAPPHRVDEARVRLAVQLVAPLEQPARDQLGEAEAYVVEDGEEGARQPIATRLQVEGGRVAKPPQLRGQTLYTRFQVAGSHATTSVAEGRSGLRIATLATTAPSAYAVHACPVSAAPNLAPRSAHAAGEVHGGTA
jgi:hypothetical protein